jgi:hypothetical protein
MLVNNRQISISNMYVEPLKLQPPWDQTGVGPKHFPNHGWRICYGIKTRKYAAVTFCVSYAVLRHWYGERSRMFALTNITNTVHWFL